MQNKTVLFRLVSIVVLFLLATISGWIVASVVNSGNSSTSALPQIEPPETKNENLPPVEEADSARLASEALQIRSLLRSALKAFERERYITPEEDNTILYVDRILQINPANREALNLHGLVRRYYVNRASYSIRRQRYATAADAYEKLLRITPNDADIRQKKELLLRLDAERRRAFKANSPATGREQTESPSQQTSEIKPESETGANIETERIVNSLSAKTDDAHPLAVAESISGLQDFPESNNLASTGDATLDLLGLVVESAAENSSQNLAGNPEAGEGTDAADLKLLLTEDPEPESSFIIDVELSDAGRAQYLHRENVRKPRSIPDGVVSIVRAQCVVGTGGAVEEVNIISVSSPGFSANTHEQLLQLATETLKKYRYVPATMNRKPTRFSVLEAVSFK